MCVCVCDHVCLTVVCVCLCVYVSMYVWQLCVHTCLCICLTVCEHVSAYCLCVRTHACCGLCIRFLVSFYDPCVCSDDGLIAGGNHGGPWRVFLLGWGAAEEVPGDGLSGRHGEEQQQPKTLLQVNTAQPGPCAKPLCSFLTDSVRQAELQQHWTVHHEIRWY